MPADADKPLDLGTGAVCASFDAVSASWLSFGFPHREVGFVELSGLPAFDERRRGDPAATRAHRLRMTAWDSAFLRVEVDGRAPRLTVDADDPEAPRWSGRGLSVRALAEPGSGSIRQHWSFGRKGLAGDLAIRVRGDLDRPALAEITETDPPRPTGARTTVRADGSGLVVEAEALSASVAISIRGAEVAWRTVGDELVGGVAGLTGDGDLVIACTGPGADHPEPVGSDEPARHLSEPIVDRAIAYVQGCTALRVAQDERTILTDHRMLPLSWTRDAYWQALLLLAVDGPGDRDRIADHLRWLWRRCERPEARWVRSHHANGLRKDLAFQADQQLYPLLELADFWRLTGALPGGVDWPTVVPAAWQAALREVDPATGLIASAENAADDPATAPYIGASQLLLWYTAARLTELAHRAAIGVEPASLRAAADDARTAFDRAFVEGDRPWPYAVDADGGRVAYHDANDLPIALAPLWGFCAATDPGWLATTRFAFGPDNPGFVPGPHGGLGSAHTPGPWTLGHVQAWAIGRARGDSAAMATALERLRSAAFHDGMLPEAHGADGSPIRHWFAWPGAAIAALLLLDARGVLGRTLAAAPDG